LDLRRVEQERPPGILQQRQKRAGIENVDYAGRDVHPFPGLGLILRMDCSENRRALIQQRPNGRGTDVSRCS
jgi:hypothetical protein